jgi:hypothetical protein
MRFEMTPNEAEDLYCPFALPTRQHCLGDGCMAWEEGDDCPSAHGDCSLLIHRREIVNGLGPILTVDVRKLGE